MVNALVETGIRVSLDDFGTGVTNLAQLGSVAFSEIKVDRMFVDGLDKSPANAAIVSSLIELGHRLGCTVTAEGVETAAVVDWLRRHGCDLGQGFHWSRPRPWPDVVEQMLGIQVASPAETTDRTRSEVL